MVAIGDETTSYNCHRVGSGTANLDEVNRMTEIVVERDVECVVRDGTTLRSDVYRPHGQGELPILLCRTPYGKASKAYVDRASYLASRGYCVVVQDHRGRHASEGTYRWMWTERVETGDAEDGFDTVEWAARLPWVNGRVGAFGHSNDGWSVWTLLSLRPPSLRAASAGGMTPHMRDFTLGFFETGRRLQWIFEMAVDTRRRSDLDEGPDAKQPTSQEAAVRRWHEMMHELVWSLPLREIPQTLFNGLHGQYIDLLRNSHGEFMHFDDVHELVDVPILLITGWWDRMSRTLNHLEGLQERSAPSVRYRHKAIVGPWGHSSTSFSHTLGPLDFGPSAGVSYDDLLVDWFDEQLKGAPSSRASHRPLKYFLVGSNVWLEGDQWPPADIEPHSLFFDSEGLANSGSGDGRLSTSKPTGAEWDTYTYDPNEPVQSLMDPDYQRVPLDQTPREARDDVLVFRSEQMKGTLEVTGEPEVVLWAASDTYDTDWIVTLAVVFDGEPPVNVSFGGLRARFRHGFNSPQLLTPGEPFEYRITMLPVALSLNPGDELRVYITSSDFPMFDRNHNTGREDWQEADLRVARQTVFHTTEMSSRLILPVRGP